MGIRKYFRVQLGFNKYLLEHDVLSDFYLSTYRNSVTLLLILRFIIFAGCLSIMISSMVLTTQTFPFNYWPIYLTHWGLVLNTVASGFALIVSIAAFVNGSIDASQGLPWHVKTYWASFNMATPIALFITIFYWVLLTGVEQDFAINLTLDIFIHAVNSILMLALLLVSRHPINLSHFYFSMGVGIVYLIFTIIYYFAGGKDPFGNNTIYPMIDWSKPGETIGIMLLSALGIIIFHVLTAAISEGRNALSRRCSKRVQAYSTDEAYY